MSDNTSEKSRTRGRPRKAETSQNILTAAFDLLSQIPYADISIEKIADQAGVTRPTVYRRWANKEALIADTIHMALIKINPAAPTVSDPKEALKIVFMNLVEALTKENFAVVVANIVGELPHNPTLREATQEPLTVRRQIILKSVLSKVQASNGLMNTHDIEVIIDMMLGAVYYRLLLSSQPVDEAYIDKLIDTVLT